MVASLPCYQARNTDAQRGDGVFEASIAALRRLNDLGYGHPGSGRTLNLVYNPSRRVPGRRNRHRSNWNIVASCGTLTASSSTACSSSTTCRSTGSWSSCCAPASTNLHAAVDRRLQPRRSGRGDVPDDTLGRLGWPPLRLRLQPDARNLPWPRANRQHIAEFDPVPPRRSAGHDRPSLPWLHGWRRLKLHGPGCRIALRPRRRGR